jgi:thiol-disulfide isomerase/thioredoxin
MLTSLTRHFLAFVVVSFSSGCRPTLPPSAPHALLNTSLPEIHHRDTLEGVPFNNVELLGKPVVIKFFAEYCEPCKKTLPAVERLHESNRDVVFVGIDEDESLSTARSVVQRYGLTFVVIHDPSNVLSGRFRVGSMPTTFVADKLGVIRWVGDEKQTEEDLRRAVGAVQ